MKSGFQAIDKTQRDESTIVWLCGNGTEWATYVSVDDNPDNTVLGRYFNGEDAESEARANYAERQKPPQEYNPQPRIEHLDMLDVDYANAIAASPDPAMETLLQTIGFESEDAAEITEGIANPQGAWNTVLRGIEERTE